MVTVARSTSDTPPDATARSRTDALLIWTATLFAAAVVLHGLDHARRGADSVGLDVFWVGTAAIALEVGVVVLVMQRHRLAPLAAAVTGLSLATGYVVVHFLPARSWLSDSLTSVSDVSRLSWAAASLEVVAATALGVAGLLVLRRRGGLASAAEPRADEHSLRWAALHPVVLTMASGNVVILVTSAVQLARA